MADLPTLNKTVKEFRTLIDGNFQRTQAQEEKRVKQNEEKMLKELTDRELKELKEKQIKEIENRQERIKKDSNLLFN